MHCAVYLLTALSREPPFAKNISLHQSSLYLCSQEQRHSQISRRILRCCLWHLTKKSFPDCSGQCGKVFFPVLKAWDLNIQILNIKPIHATVSNIYLTVPREFKSYFSSTKKNTVLLQCSCHTFHLFLVGKSFTEKYPGWNADKHCSS